MVTYSLHVTIRYATFGDVAFRFASERIDAAQIQRTGAGALRVPGVITRSGVFEYRDAAGNVVREWRPPEEVLKADSLASMRDLPVTIRHPSSFVDPSTWQGLSIGHVSSGTIKEDSTLKAAAAELVISRADAISKIGKDLKEISYGYKVRIDATPGVVPEGYPDAGKAYDVVQRDIIGNHVALGPSNWGRQGSAVSLRLDSAGDECPPVEIKEEQERKSMKIRIDGIEFEAATEAELQAKIDAHNAQKQHKADSDAVAAEKARADALEKANAKLIADAEQARKDAAEAPVKYAARQALEASAKSVLGNAEKFDGKSDREVQLAVIRKFDSAYSDKEVPDVAVKATYDVWCKTHAASRPRVDASSARIALALSGANQDGTPKVDENRADEGNQETAQARRRNRIDNANKSAFTITQAGAQKAQMGG